MTQLAPRPDSKSLSAALACLAFACADAPGPLEAATDPTVLLRSDRRIAPLYGSCEGIQGRFYDRDTADFLPVLIEKLQTGEQEPLQRAKEELGAMGARSVEHLRRFFEQHATEKFGTPYLENAIDAAGLNPDLGARVVLLAALQQPQNAVRRRALRALRAGHILPEDFDTLLEHVEFEPGEMGLEFAVALHEADPARAELTYLEWLASDLHRDAWNRTIPLVAGSTGAATVAAAARAFDGARPALQVWLAACAAQGGDGRFLEHLAGELEAPDPARRGRAVQALAAGDWTRLLGEVALADEDATLRVLALEGIAAHEPFDEVHRGWLRLGMDDASPVVRSQATLLLVQRGDSAAIDRALSQLGGQGADLQESLTALRDVFEEDPALAKRAFDGLATRYRVEQQLPPRERLATLKALGLIPVLEAAHILRREGLALEGEEVEGLRAHRWMMIQAANTGEEGRAFLFDELATEEDPLRRIDLIAAMSSGRTEAERERLRRLLVAGPANDVELLFAAQLACKLGPGARIAPILKRISYGVEDPETRVALQCMLWRWF